MIHWYIWVGFVAFVAALLAVDLGIFHRRAHDVAFKEALTWTGVWVAVALAMAGAVWAWLGGQRAGEFLAGYLIEWSLSVDNVFVFVLIFTHFAVPRPYQHRVLFWGVVGAICLRLAFILSGAALLDRFNWAVYVFGGLLIVTAVRFLMQRDGGHSLDDSRMLRVVRRVLPLTEHYDGQTLLTKQGRRVMATPLLAVLVMVELTDVVFAIDSIPAVLAITREAFIVFASNALAILGLRSLYFVLSGAVGKFRFLKPSLAGILGFVGMKMLLSSVVEIPVVLSLPVIVGVLGAGIVASWLLPGPTRAPEGAGGGRV